MSNQAFEFRHDSHLETALGTVRPFEQRLFCRID